MRFAFRGHEVVFLDVEASGLGGDSYPVEVGWVTDDEAPPGSLLVRPHESWTFWSGVAQAMHGLTREILEREGLPVAAVCDRVEAACAGRLVVSDAHAFDDWWLRRLYGAAGRSKAWQVGNVELLYGGLAAQAELGAHEAAGALIAAERAYPHPHRAGPDALRLAKGARALADPGFRARLLGEFT